MHSFSSFSDFDVATTVLQVMPVSIGNCLVRCGVCINKQGRRWLIVLKGSKDEIRIAVKKGFAGLILITHAVWREVDAKKDLWMWNGLVVFKKSLTESYIRRVFDTWKVEILQLKPMVVSSAGADGNEMGGLLMDPKPKRKNQTTRKQKEVVIVLDDVEETSSSENEEKEDQSEDFEMLENEEMVCLNGRWWRRQK